MDSDDKEPLDQMEIVEGPWPKPDGSEPQYNKGPGDRWMNCCLILGILTLIVYIVGIIVFGAVYYQFFISGELEALQGKVSQLEMQLNQSQFVASSLSAQLSDSQITNTVNAAVANINRTTASLPSSRDSLISELETILAAIETNFTRDIADTDVSNLEALIARAQIDYNTGLQQLESRLQANSDQSLQLFVNELNADQTEYQTNITSEEGDNFFRGIVIQLGGGTRSTYVRWGSSSCPTVAGTSLIYSGYMAGSAYFHTGGGHNHVCMPMDPDVDALPTQSGVQGWSTIYGAEYAGGPKGDHNLPCAVCSVTIGSEVIMIPQRNSCPSGWTMEYDGYLMSEGPNNYRTSFSCIDRSLGALPGSEDHSEASDLFTVGTNCQTGSLSCPPYRDDITVGCAVCSK